MRKMANELIITEEQKENPMPSDKPAHIQWHPGYVSAIKMEFKDDKNDYCFGSAWKVGSLPLEIDMVISNFRTL